MKCYPLFFSQVVRDIKRFELRRDDRGYKSGEELLLREYSDSQGYTGRRHRVRVRSLLRDYPGIEDGYVVMSLDPVGEIEHEHEGGNG